MILKSMIALMNISIKGFVGGVRFNINKDDVGLVVVCTVVLRSPFWSNIGRLPSLQGRVSILHLLKQMNTV